MKIAYFIGLFISILLFGMPWLLSEDRSCYLSSPCSCFLDIAYRPIHIFGTLFFASFFLLYNTTFVFKFWEIRPIIKTTYVSESAVYKLPLIQFFSKIGVGVSLAMFPFSYLFLNITCISTPSCGDSSTCFPELAYEDESGFAMICCAAGLYFTILTVWSLLKSYPRKK